MAKYQFNDLLEMTIDELEAIKAEVLKEHADLLNKKASLASDIVCIQELNKEVITKVKVLS